MNPTNCGRKASVVVDLDVCVEEHLPGPQHTINSVGTLIYSVRVADHSVASDFRWTAANSAHLACALRLFPSYHHHHRILGRINAPILHPVAEYPNHKPGRWHRGHGRANTPTSRSNDLKPHAVSV